MGSVAHLHPEAIPCTYAGVDMRSRLEARWAAFFDGLGEPWEYEPRQYRMRGQHAYTPDFYLPGIDTIVEVKPAPIEDIELAEKYAAYAPWLIKRGACRLFVFAIRSPRGRADYAAVWRHGLRWFSFARAFGERAVDEACVYVDHLGTQRMPAIEPTMPPSWRMRFANMTLAEIKDDAEFKQAFTTYQAEHQ